MSCKQWLKLLQLLISSLSNVDSDLDYCQEMISQFQGNQSNKFQERYNHGRARRGSTRAKEIRDKLANYFLDN